MTIKEIFEKAENGMLTFDTFRELAKASGAKFEDIAEGNYISKNKYTDELAAKDNEIATLTATISTRDADLADLQGKLEVAGTDAQKLAALSTDFDSLKGKYDEDTKNYKAQLKKQAYEFAVREFANNRKFTSNAAKRDFINSMIAKDLKMESDKILGAEDFVTAYRENNADAFVVETPTPTPAPKPEFISPTPGPDPKPTVGDEFVNAFNFTGVRAKED